MLKRIFVYSLQCDGLIFCDPNTNSPPLYAFKFSMLIVCSFHGVEWNHPTACGFQKGKHKHGETLVGSWRADRCQNQGESFYSLNMMLSLFGNGLGLFACFFVWLGFFSFSFHCCFLSQRLGTWQFIVRNSASVVVSCSLFWKWDFRCGCYKWLKPQKFSLTQLQKC